MLNRRPNTAQVATASTLAFSLASYSTYTKNQKGLFYASTAFALISAGLAVLQHPSLKGAKDNIVNGLNRVGVSGWGMWTRPTPGGDNKKPEQENSAANKPK